MDSMTEMTRRGAASRTPSAGEEATGAPLPPSAPRRAWMAWGVLAALVSGTGACTDGTDEAGELGARPPAAVVDSIFPIEEEIRRFREGLPEVTTLSGGAPDRDALVAEFVRAVEAADTAALAPLVLDRAEFGWLYYPHTMYTEPPYELSPALLWFQMQNLSSRSLTRLFRRYAGQPLHARGYACEEEPRVEGPNRVWNECRLRLEAPGSEPVELRLFGSVVERDGTYKFVSYASEL